MLILSYQFTTYCKTCQKQADQIYLERTKQGDDKMKKKLNAKVWVAISGIVLAVVAQFLPEQQEFATQIMTFVGMGLTALGIFDSEQKDDV